MYLHGASVDLDTIIVFGRLCRVSRLRKDDGRYTDTATSLVVCEKNLFDSANGVREVVLQENCVSVHFWKSNVALSKVR